jgi:hypothetical protein
MHGYVYIYLDIIYMVITLPKAGYDTFQSVQSKTWIADAQATRTISHLGLQ